MGWMLRVVGKGGGCNPPTGIAIKRLASIGIYVETREIAARNIDADAMPLVEHERGWIHLDCELIHLSRCHQLRFFQRTTVAGTNNGIGDVQIDAGGKIIVWRVDIDEFGCK